jgi:P27 family predicted phage terminase small subunit
MGARGPAPKPTAIKKLQGNPGKRKLNTLEPIPAAGPCDCPDHLDEIAKKEWGRVSGILTRMKVLTEADYIALGTLCQAYSTLIAAQRQLNKSGMLYKTQSGYVQQSPLFGIIHAQTNIVNALIREFGLTPSSRTRLSVVSPEEKPKNKFASLGEELKPLQSVQ